MVGFIALEFATQVWVADVNLRERYLDIYDWTRLAEGHRLAGCRGRAGQGSYG